MAYLCPNIHFDASGFSERSSEEIMFLLTLRVVFCKDLKTNFVLLY